MILLSAVLILGFVVWVLAAYVKTSRKYWTKRGVPNLKCTSLFGHIENPFRPKRGLMMDVKHCYDGLKRRGKKHGGMYFFTDPIYLPVDPDLIKSILTKDFPHFLGHGLEFDSSIDPLTAHLFHLEGEKWRKMRVMLSPTFTSGKLKTMFKTLLDCGSPMIDHVNMLCEKNEAVDIKETLACYTTDVIGSCAFGLECNSFKDPDAEFRKFGRKIFEISFRDLVYQFMAFWAPGLLKRLKLKVIGLEIDDFFINTVKNIINYRTRNGILRNDFMQLFLEMREQAAVRGEESLTVNEIAAQAFIFFVAGFETSSTTMTFCLHELAFHQEMQDALRLEIRETLKKNGGTLTYDAVMEMKYMDKIINETLRKYPPVPIVTRVCSLDYKVPNTDVTLKKGTKVFISTLGLHRDEDYYQDPVRFDPERFSDENKASRPAYTYLPFGEGPRICIGLRFGLMQVKVGLCMLLDKFKIKPLPKENYNIYFNPESFILAKQGPVMLNVEKL